VLNHHSGIESEPHVVQPHRQLARGGLVRLRRRVDPEAQTGAFKVGDRYTPRASVCPTPMW